MDIGDLPPTLLERGYYLTPQKEAVRAYRLLAEVMEQTRRAGIATVVMRDREYLIAIFARNSILCAETLRFGDELRDPKAIGLPAPSPPDKARVSAFTRSISALFRKTLVHQELADEATEALRKLIEKKQKQGRDIIRAAPEAGDPGEAGSPDADGDDPDEQGDLLETIRQSLRHAGSASGSKSSPGKSKAGQPRRTRKDEGTAWSRGKKPSRTRKGG